MSNLKYKSLMVCLQQKKEFLLAENCKLRVELSLDSCFHFSLSTTKRNGKKSSLFRILGSVIFLTIYRQMYLVQFRVVDMRNSNTKVDFQKRISERIQLSRWQAISSLSRHIQVRQEVSIGFCFVLKLKFRTFTSFWSGRT